MTTAFATTSSHALHAQPGHIERPERLDAVLKVLRDDPVWTRLQHMPAPAAGLEVARLVHPEAYLQRFADAAAARTSLDADTYTTPASVTVALESLGAVLAVTRAVLDGTATNGFAATRPPGHHATPDQAMGFCLLSNVAIAARWAEAQFGVERILIVDFDVHHGNGTQAVFYDDPNRLFMSVHQHPLYPGTGAVDEIGTGPGHGATVNVPLPPGTDEVGYLDTFRRVFAPIAARFKPELILVSAGYDAHWQDPLGSMHLDVRGFGHLMQEVLHWADALCDHRLVAVLEGGYQAAALAGSVRASMRLLLDPTDLPDVPEPAPSGTTDVKGLLQEIAAYHGV